MLYKGHGVSAMQDIAGNQTIEVQEDDNKRLAVMPGTDIFRKLVARAREPEAALCRSREAARRLNFRAENGDDSR